MWPLPSLSLAVSVAAASLLPLYLAATSLYAGPTFFSATAWQFKQPFAFARSAPASAAPTPPAITMLPAAASTNNIVFIRSPIQWLISRPLEGHGFKRLGQAAG